MMKVYSRRQLMMEIGRPYDAEIEYLGSDGSSYINTGIYPNYSDNVELIFKLSDVASSIRDNLSFFGAFRGWAQDAFHHIWNNENVFHLPIGGYVNRLFILNESNYTNNWHSFVLKGTNCILDGATTTVSRAVGATNVPMYVFVSNLNNLVLYGYGTKRYFKNFKLLDSNNIPKLDLIPVRVGNVGYMYDKVSGKLFGNSGTGEFILGPDK